MKKQCCDCIYFRILSDDKSKKYWCAGKKENVGPFNVCEHWKSWDELKK